MDKNSGDVRRVETPAEVVGRVERLILGDVFRFWSLIGLRCVPSWSGIPCVVASLPRVPFVSRKGGFFEASPRRCLGSRGR